MKYGSHNTEPLIADKWFFYTTKFDKFHVLKCVKIIDNFMCQMYFHRLNKEFLTNFSKNPYLHGQKIWQKGLNCCVAKRKSNILEMPELGDREGGCLKKKFMKKQNVNCAPVVSGYEK